jgi:hypothetical protein
MAYGKVDSERTIWERKTDRKRIARKVRRANDKKEANNG